MLCSPGREKLRAMAVSCFHRQTYANRELVLVDGSQQKTIGALRNEACIWADGDLIAHWDDDDWSAPERLEEQVAFLLEHELDCTGYQDMPFCDTADGGAYLYRNPDTRYCVGTSLLYRRASWESRKFDDVQTGEDKAFVLTREHVLSQPSNGRMVALAHEGNTADKRSKFSLWQKLDSLPERFLVDAAQSRVL